MTWQPMDIALYRGRGALVLGLDGGKAELAMAHLRLQRVPVSSLRQPSPGPPMRREEAVAERESWVRQRGLR